MVDNIPNELQSDVYPLLQMKMPIYKRNYAESFQQTAGKFTKIA